MSEREIANQPSDLAAQVRALIKQLKAASTPEVHAAVSSALSRVYVQGFNDRAQALEEPPEHLVRSYAQWTFESLLYGLEATQVVPQPFVEGVIAGFSKALVFIVEHDNCSEETRGAVRQLLTLFEGEIKTDENEEKEKC